MNDRPRRSLTNPLAAARNNISVTARRHRPDYWILILASLLLVIGLVVVYSISPGLAASQGVSQGYFITKQLIDVSLGLAAFAIAAYLPVAWWWRVAIPLAVIAIVASAAVMLMPVDEVTRAHRWLKAGNFSFQVAELIKLALLVWTAKFLTMQWRAAKLADFKSTLRPLLAVVAAVGLAVAVLQSDLGSAGVIVAMVMLMAYVAGIPMKRVLLIVGVVAAIVIIAVAVSPYRRERLSTFLNPGQNCQDAGYQACQALVSVGSGGVFGLGLGHSVQAYGYLPEAGNDSIFAIIAEKFGFIGSVLVLVLYAGLISRMKRVIDHTADQFSRLLVAGVLAWLSTQMVINVGAMLGLLPLKGITLPFISQGGTSLVFMTAALGIVFHISRYTGHSKTEPNKVQIERSDNYSSHRRRVGRAHNPAVFARPRT